jgi:hypothetical protein
MKNSPNKLALFAAAIAITGTSGNALSQFQAGMQGMGGTGATAGMAQAVEVLAQLAELAQVGLELAVQQRVLPRRQPTVPSVVKAYLARLELEALPE